MTHPSRRSQNDGPGRPSSARASLARWIRQGWKIISSPLRALFALLPRSPVVWVFGSWFGERFTDNPKYLYLHVLQNHPEVRAIWLARKAEVVQEVRALGGEAHHIRSLTGAFWQLRAGVVVVSVGIQDVGSAVTGGAAIVQTWHGIPLKQIGIDRFHERPGGLAGSLWSMRNSMLRREWQSYRMVLATSAETQQRFAGAFGVPAERVPVLGYPRNDVLVDQVGRAAIRSEVLAAVGLSESDDSRIIAYVPTHRDSGRGSLTLFPFPQYDYADLEAFLERTGSVLIYKRHFFHESSRVATKGGPRRRVVDGTKALPDVQRLLACADVLVTDLSSCFFDFLLRDRPIVFVTPEIDEYVETETGLYYPYGDVTPGPHAATFPAFLNALERSLSDPEVDRDRRASVRGVFHEYCDTNSAERVYEYVRRLSDAGPNGSPLGKSSSEANEFAAHRREVGRDLGFRVRARRRT